MTATAIVEFAGIETVWKVVADQCEEQRIETAARRESWVEISSGLAAGDIILADGRMGRRGPVRPVRRVLPTAGPDPLAAAELAPDSESDSEPIATSDSGGP